MVGQGESGVEELKYCRDKFASVVARQASVSAASGVEPTESGPALAEVLQLKDALAKCTQQKEQMQKAFVERRPLGEPAVAAQYQGPYAVPPPQFVSGVFNQQVPPTTLGTPPLLMHWPKMSPST